MNSKKNNNCCIIKKIIFIIFLITIYIYIIKMKDGTFVNVNSLPKFTEDLEGKFLFMRHGETIFNADHSQTQKINPNNIDAPLSETGIEQVRESQSIIYNLKLEKVYVSPFYRTLQTVTYALENYPNLENIVVVVHPALHEKTNNVHDYSLDIKKSKEEFNMNSNVKIDWSLFDEYVKKDKWDENFYYFDGLVLFDEKEKNDLYLKLKNLYDKGEKEKFKNELVEMSKMCKDDYKKKETFKHVFQRFVQFRKDMLKFHKNTLNDNDSKILAVTHSSFLRTVTSRTPYDTDEIEDYHDDGVKVPNAKIISIYMD